MLGSITGGAGGMSNSSSAASSSGDSNIGFNQTFGGLTVGGKNQWVWPVVAVLLLVVGFLLWQQFK